MSEITIKPSTLVTPVVLVMNDEYFLPYALEASRGFFSRYVIYDVGSSDSTREVIKKFIESCSDVVFYVRYLPALPPSIQGIFRNSMIAESLTEFYFILDGDEVYTQDSYRAIINAAEAHATQFNKLYGVVRRIEVGDSLQEAYGQDEFVPHHRLYRRTAIWQGNHPGEVPYFVQDAATEFQIPDATCVHFHNCARSSDDESVPRRIERRTRGTYRPGTPTPFDLFATLPLMKNRFMGTPINSTLEALQNNS